MKAVDGRSGAKETNIGLAEFVATSAQFYRPKVAKIETPRQGPDTPKKVVNLLHVTIFIIYPYDDSSIMHPFFVVGEIASSALRGHDKIPLRANRRHSRSLPPSPVVSSLTGLPECHRFAPVSMSPRASVIPSEHFSSHQSTAQGASQ